MPDLVPGTYILNGRKDLAMLGEIRAFINKQVTVVKKCKSGLYQIRTETGELFSVSKHNLETEVERQYQLNRSPVVDLSGWTIEVMQDTNSQHGLDLESHITACLIEELNK